MMKRATQEPGLATVDIWLPSPEALVEPMRHQVMCLSKRVVLTVDDHNRQPGARCAWLGDESGVHHPEPEPVRLPRVLGSQPYGQDSYLRDARDVFQCVAIEQPSGSLCAAWLPRSGNGSP